MEEEWRQILGFPSYSVNDQGSVRNDETERILTPFLTGPKRNTLSVGLIHHRTQYTRTVGRLVANAFLQPLNEYHDTPIHLDRDKLNCRVDNLLWRPRWFAREYTIQFSRGLEMYPAIRDLETEEVFETPWEVVPLRGLLYRDVVEATHRHTHVFPTMDLFEWLE